MNDVQNENPPQKDYTQELNDGNWEDAILARWEDAERKSQPSEDTPEATPDIEEEETEE